ncbi:hypothetical protein K9M79_05555 [Candidatus Woesearchaeota archaeon]|nr:hypothetical protein [Candidatus Woesearchaeota archaeon]
MITRHAAILVILIIILTPAAFSSSNLQIDNQSSVSSLIIAQGALSKINPIQNSLESESSSIHQNLLHSIQNVEAYGADYIIGYRRQDDTTSATAKVKIDDDCNISADQVMLGAVPFSSCTPVGNCYHECSVTSSQDYLLAKRHYLAIRLMDKNGSELYADSSSGSVVVDNLGPEITSLSLSSGQISSSTNLSISYTAQDYAYSTSYTNLCSGLSEVKIQVNGADKESLYPVAGETCTKSETIQRSPSQLGLINGENTICLHAFDKFGYNSSTSCKTVSHDSTNPSFSLVNYTVTDTNNGEIQYFYSGQTVRLNIEVSITDTNGSGIDDSTVQINASVLNLTNPIIYGYKCGTTNYCFSDIDFTCDSDSLNHKLHASAEDNVDNKVDSDITISYTFNKDTTTPQLLDLVVFDSNGNDMQDEWIDNSSHYVSVMVNISEGESGFTSDNVYGDFSDLVNGSEGDPYDPFSGGGIYQQAAQCQSLGNNVSACYFSNVQLQRYESGSFSIIINVTDNRDNFNSRTYSYSFKIDGSGPNVNSLTVSNGVYSGYSGAGKFISAENNTFTLSISESQSGTDDTMMFLDLSNVNGNSKEQATNCSNSSCTWEEIDATSASDGENITVKISSDSHDAVGNPITGNLTHYFITDLSPPELDTTSVYIVDSVLNATYNISGELIAVGDSLNITFTGTDISGIKQAYANFTPIINNSGNLSATCTNNDTDSTGYGYDFACTWIVGVVDISGSPQITFMIEDFMGQITEYTIEYYVVGFMNQTDYIYHELSDPSPAQIDKESISFFDPFMYFPLTFKSQGSGYESIQILDISVDSCYDPTNINDSSNGTKSSDYLSSANGNKPLLIDVNTPPIEPPYDIISEVVLDRVLPPNDTLEFNCTFTIHLLLNTTSTSNISIEQENVSFSIDYMNSPLGTMDDAVITEIDDVLDGWLVQMEWLDSLETILNYANLICKLNNVWVQVKQIYAIVADGYKGCCLIAPTNTACCVSQTNNGLAKKASTEGWQEASESFLSKYCNMLSCRAQNASMKEDGWMKDLADRNAKYKSDLKNVNFGINGSENYVGIKDNIVLSAYYLCLPGVIENLNKMRVIECTYASCLNNTMYGQPATMCVNQRELAWCRYVWGQFLNWIPFVAWANAIGDKLQTAFSSVPALLTFSIDVACTAICTQATAPGSCTLCSWLETLNLFLEFLCNIGIGADEDSCKPIWESFDTIGDDSVCETAISGWEATRPNSSSSGSGGSGSSSDFGDGW